MGRRASLRRYSLGSKVDTHNCSSFMGRINEQLLVELLKEWSESRPLKGKGPNIGSPRAIASESAASDWAVNSTPLDMAGTLISRSWATTVVWLFRARI